eukprot:3862033-Rhodomonas_salina.1
MDGCVLGAHPQSLHHPSPVPSKSCAQPSPDRSRACRACACGSPPCRRYLAGLAQGEGQWGGCLHSTPLQQRQGGQVLQQTSNHMRDHWSSRAHMSLHCVR